MKAFLYDTVLDKENICNLEKEREHIERAVKKASKIVVMGPRNFGKTSLIKSAIVPNFTSRHKNPFVYFCDLMEVKSMESIDRRLSKSFEIAFAQTFPARNFVDAARRFLGSLRPEISIDPANGAPALSLTSRNQNKTASGDEIFKAILEIAGERKTIIILDEFQDIAFVEEAQGLFRRLFQDIRDVPVIVMGSKRHILADIMAKPNAPLAMFGIDIEFGLIPYEKYHSYILERFEQGGLTMSLEDSTHLQDAVMRVPEAINMVCSEIMDEFKGRTVGKKEIEASIRGTVEKRQSRYEEFLAHFTENEESIVTAMAQMVNVKHPNGQEFLRMVRPTSRMVGIIVADLYRRSVIDKKPEGYFISDPLFARYLTTFR